jgi:hypothetical protein
MGPGNVWPADGTVLTPATVAGSELDRHDLSGAATQGTSNGHATAGSADRAP